MRPARVKGMLDLLPNDCQLYDHIIKKSTGIVNLYGYQRISTPILEYSPVFERSLGDGTDILTKELYKFTDKNDQLVTMRPEGTACIVRAMITNGLLRKSLCQRLFYHGPMFRYENPQKGRLRQFEQFGVEAFGLGHPLADAEVIGMAWQILKSLQLADECRLEINTLGDTESRQRYRQALCEFFTAHSSQLSALSQDRLLNGHIFRILDSKDATDKLIISEKPCPSVLDYLSRPAAQRFHKVQDMLKSLGIPFVHNHHLVRGLDYYSHTIFEIVHRSNTFGSKEQQLGPSQSTVIAGGRYDGLLERVQNSNSGSVQQTPAIGWAAGINRLMMLLMAKQRELLPAADISPVLLIFVPPSTTTTRDANNDGARIIQYGMKVAQTLRQSEIGVSLATELFSTPDGEEEQWIPAPAKQLSRLLRLSAAQPPFAVFVGPEELASETVTVKDLRTAQQQPSVDLQTFIVNFHQLTGA